MNNAFKIIYNQIRELKQKNKNREHINIEALKKTNLEIKEMIR